MFTSPLIPNGCTFVLETTIAFASEVRTPLNDAEAAKYAASLRSKFIRPARSATSPRLRLGVIYLPQKVKNIFDDLTCGLSIEFAVLTVSSRNRSQTDRPAATHIPVSFPCCIWRA